MDVITRSRAKDQVVEPALLHTGPVPAAVHQRGPGGGLQDSQKQDVSDRRSQSRIEQKKMGKRSLRKNAGGSKAPEMRKLAFLAIPIMVTAGTPGGASLRRPGGRAAHQVRGKARQPGTEEEGSGLGV